VAHRTRDGGFRAYPQAGSVPATLGNSSWTDLTSNSSCNRPVIVRRSHLPHLRGVDYPQPIVGVSANPSHHDGVPLAAPRHGLLARNQRPSLVLCINRAARSTSLPKTPRTRPPGPENSHASIDISKRFTAGDFDLPMFIHDTTLPGTATWPASRNQIANAYSETPNAAKILISSDNAKP